MSKAAKIIVLGLCISVMLAGCEATKKGYEEEVPKVMTVVDKTSGYTIYKHDNTGVWYFCRDGGYGRSVVVMVNPDGTLYTESSEGTQRDE